LLFGGRGGIRTHGTVAGTIVFKTISIDHSDTLPNTRLAESLQALSNPPETFIRLLQLMLDNHWLL
jgi:hypothetical protein